MTTHYHIDLFWSGRDDCWIADVPDLRYCSAHGETSDEAVREIQVAMNLYLESLRDHGDPMPELRYRPAPADKIAA